MYFVDEREGRFAPVGPPTKDYLTKDPKKSIMNEVEAQNKDTWFQQLQHTSFNAYGGEQHIEKVLSEDKKADQDPEKTLQFYKKYLEDPQQAEQIIEKLGPEGAVLKNKMLELTHGDVYLRDSYQSLKKLFNQAYDALERSDSKKAKGDLKLLEQYRKEVAPKIEQIENDPSQITKFGDEIVKGVNILRRIDPPQRLKPLRDFALDKASDTFSGVALKSYKKFKEKSPIISIENPPMGMGLATGQDLRDLAMMSRKKFVKKAKEELGMSEGEAKAQAEKLIGVTWDIGHINMLRKYGTPHFFFCLLSLSFVPSLSRYSCWLD